MQTCTHFWVLNFAQRRSFANMKSTFKVRCEGFQLKSLEDNIWRHWIDTTVLVWLNETEKCSCERQIRSFANIPFFSFWQAQYLHYRFIITAMLVSRGVCQHVVVSNDECTPKFKISDWILMFWSAAIHHFTPAGNQCCGVSGCWE